MWSQELEIVRFSRNKTLIPSKLLNKIIPLWFQDYIYSPMAGRDTSATEPEIKLWIPNPQETKSLSITSASTSEYISVPSPGIIQRCEARMLKPIAWTRLRFLHVFHCVELTFSLGTKGLFIITLTFAHCCIHLFSYLILCTDMCWIQLKYSASLTTRLHSVHFVLCKLGF